MRGKGLRRGTLVSQYIGVQYTSCTVVSITHCVLILWQHFFKVEVFRFVCCLKFNSLYIYYCICILVLMLVVGCGCMSEYVNRHDKLYSRVRNPYCVYRPGSVPVPTLYGDTCGLTSMISSTLSSLHTMVSYCQTTVYHI